MGARPSTGSRRMPERRGKFTVSDRPMNAREREAAKADADDLAAARRARSGQADKERA